MEDGNYDTFDKYLNKQLSADEKQRFEEELTKNKALAEELALYKDLGFVVSTLSKKKVKTTIGDIDQKLDQEGFFKQNKRLKIWRPIAIAATVLLLILTGTLLWANFNYSNPVLATKYDQYQVPSASSRSQDPQIEDPVLPGLQALEDGDFQSAIALLGEISSQSDFYSEAQFLLAYTYQKMEDYPNAIPIYQNVIAAGDKRFKEQAEWNLVLTLLKAKESPQQVKALLDSIETSKDHSFRRQAIQLKSDLASFWRNMTL